MPYLLESTPTEFVFDEPRPPELGSRPGGDRCTPEMESATMTGPLSPGDYHFCRLGKLFVVIPTPNRRLHEIRPRALTKNCRTVYEYTSIQEEREGKGD